MHIAKPQNVAMNTTPINHAVNVSKQEKTHSNTKQAQKASANEANTNEGNGNKVTTNQADTNQSRRV